MKRLLVITMLALALGAAPASAILNGQPDGDAHPYVGFVTNGQGICSGTRISTHRFLTAAHCFPPGSPVMVYFGEDARSPTEVYVGTFASHPGWCSGCGPGLGGADTNDVAIVYVPGGMLGPFADLPTMGSVASLPHLQEVTSVGYGLRVRPKVATIEFGQRFRATSVILKQESFKSGEYVKLSANPGQGKGGTCFGDSGGPSLMGNTIVAITAYGTNYNCAGVSYAQRIDIPSTREFIDGGFMAHLPS
jgi:hypothetical protein